MKRIMTMLALVVLSGCQTGPKVFVREDGMPVNPDDFYAARARCYRYAQLDMNPLDGWKFDMCMKQEGYVPQR